MGVMAGADGMLGQLDDTVTVVTPDGPDRLHTTTVTDPDTLHRCLLALGETPVEVHGVAADCRDGLAPCAFEGTYLGLTEPTGDYANIGIAFNFQPTDYDDAIALPFGWLTTIRAN